MPQTTLTTDRLALVPLAERHLPLLVELNSDAVVHRFLFHRGLTADETQAQVHRALAAAAEGAGLGQWIGFHDQTFIGLWMLEAPKGPTSPHASGEAGLGYRLPQQHWRQGYASEGARELLRHGFEDLDLSRIFAHTMAANVASRATMVSIGMTFARGFIENYDVPIAGHEQGEVEYDITRERWGS
jgi:RimJ/RimL family protein N-acetyltransferase